MGRVQALPGPATPLACTDPRALWPVQDGRPISFPSLLSHITSMHLNAEALVMPVAQEKPAPPALRSFVPLSTTLPCDFHILNLRMLQAEVSCVLQAGGHGPGAAGLGAVGVLHPLSPALHLMPWVPGRMTRYPRPRQP